MDRKKQNKFAREGKKHALRVSDLDRKNDEKNNRGQERERL